MSPELGMVERLLEDDGSITTQERLLMVAETAGAVSPLEARVAGSHLVPAFGELETKR